MTTGREISIALSAENISIKGILTIPEKASKLIIFAHGSGSGRYSPRNQFVANVLIKEQLGILLLDLLTPQEEAIDLETRQFRFDIPLLARRLVGISSWLERNQETEHLKVGYFGSSTGAAAALIAAAESGSHIFAVVSRGGRPDLASNVLHAVKTPTLLIVGGNDFGVIELNQEAYDLLGGEKKMEIVPGATHLFEEPGTLEQVAQLATQWFKLHH